MTELLRVARRFPLISRPRPACGPLQERIAHVRKIADAAAGADDPQKGLVLAAQAQNLAALIASDCGLPELARTLCWRQYDTYQAARPLNSRTARYSLEPLINLARMRVRAGDGVGAFTLLTSLWQTLSTGAPVAIDERTICLRGLTATSADHHETQSWLYRALIAEAPRALIRADQWDKALAYVTDHNAIGARLFEGRQIAVVARCLSGPRPARSALDLLAEAHQGTQWEQTVHACLSTLCLTAAGRNPMTATTRMEDTYLQLSIKQGLHMFRAQLGLAVIDLLGGATAPSAGRVMTHLVHDALQSSDGYMAREILTHLNAPRVIPEKAKHDLAHIARSAGLDGMEFLPDAQHDLVAAASSARQTAKIILACPRHRLSRAE